MQTAQQTTSTDFIPAELRMRPQWVTWRFVTRHRGRKPTKVPCTSAGKVAATDNAATWSTYADVVKAAHTVPGLNGIGFVFTRDDPFVGVDLDNCISEDGEVLPWALKFLNALRSYAEISPSGRGIKVIVKGELPGDGAGLRVTGFGPDYSGAMEMYAWGRYFTITGQLCSPYTSDADLSAINACEKIGEMYTWLRDNRDRIESRRRERMQPTPAAPKRPTASGVDFARHADQEARCIAYLKTCPPSISGQRGHDNAYRAACETIRFDLTPTAARRVMKWWSDERSGGEPWSEREIEHKLANAEKHVGSERGKRLREGQRNSSRPD